MPTHGRPDDPHALRGPAREVKPGGAPGGPDHPGGLPVVEGGGISEGEAAAWLAGDESTAPPPPAAPGSAAADDDPTVPMEPVHSAPPRPVTDDEPIPIAPTADPAAPAPTPPGGRSPTTVPEHGQAVAGGPQFRAIGVKTRRHEDAWNRTPNATGTGAIHVRTFIAKLTEDGFHALDERINEWLDAHPQYEVKFVNTTIGTVTGKLKEPHLICQVWV